MKRTLASALALVTVAGVYAQVPTFTQIAQWNNAFTGGQPNDLAFDGQNVYIARQATGNSGVVRLNVFSGSSVVTGTQNVAGTSIFQTTNAAAGRGVRVETSGNNVFFGWGLGDATAPGNAAAANGIVKLDTNGMVQTSFGTNGFLTSFASVNPSGSGVANPTRIDAFEVDPSTGNLVLTAFGSGALFQVDANTGTAASTLGFSPPNASTAWRDIAFDANGNLYARIPILNGTAQAAGQYLVRYGRAGTMFNSGTTIGSAAAQTQTFTNVADVINGGPGLSFVAWNGSANAVNITSLDGSFSTTLTGGENGFSPLTSNIVGLGGGVGVDGNTYLFVATTAGSVKVYQAVPEPGTMAALGLGATALLRRRRKASK